MSILKANGHKQYSARILAQSEILQMIADLPDSPLAPHAETLADFSGAMLVFEDPDTGKIVAHWPLMLTWHAEPCYIHPDHRGSGDLINQMIEGLQAAMAKLEVPMVYASADEPAVEKILKVLGFQRAPGEMYYAHAQPSPPTEQ